MSRSFAFVLPRFGEGIVGGAETLMGQLARALAARGDRVEVFTTCARDNRSWDNHFPAESSVQYGVLTHRFPVDGRNLEIWIPHQIAISQGRELTIDQQLEWLQQGVNSTELYAALVREAHRFERIFMGPYLFSTTFFASLAVPQKAALIPCLHDESYAYQPAIARMFELVGSCLFNSAPEGVLARRLYGPLSGGVVGMGFEPPTAIEREGLPAFFSDSKPYILYLGRKETGKNAQLLIDWFIAAKEFWLAALQNSATQFDEGEEEALLQLAELKLVIAGGGSFSDLNRPAAAERNDIVDLIEVSESEKLALLRDALCLAQLSTNESFSIVMYESWGVKTPVLMHSGCAVTRDAVEQSGGGLHCGSSAEFRESLFLLLAEPGLRESLGEQGFQYLLREFSWEAVLARFDAALESMATANSETKSV